MGIELQDHQTTLKSRVTLSGVGGKSLRRMIVETCEAPPPGEHVLQLWL